MRVIGHIVVAAIAISALTLGVPHINASSAAQPDTAASLPGPLVTAQWLHEHLKQVTVIDVGENVQRLAASPRVRVDRKTGGKTVVETGGHIPGALFVNFAKIRQVRFVNGVKLVAMMPTKAFFEKVMDDAGLKKGTTVVIAPTGATVNSLDMAARLFFQLKYFGDDNVAILNGGTNAWISAGYPISTVHISATKGTWVATAERQDLLATTEDVKASLKNHETQLIDARPTAQFFGLKKSPVVLAAGHVRGAHSFPPDVVAMSIRGAKEFMGAKQYLIIFREQGIQPNKPMITYCNTGHLASGAWFVAHEILKEKNVRLYPGSMNEWTHLGNPVVGVLG